LEADAADVDILAIVTICPHVSDMSSREKQSYLTRHPAVRISLVVLGVLLMISSIFVGPLPGPGGIIVFAGGLTLTLRYSEYAKRLYVRFKRKHPKKGEWADWGLRRRSYKRRREREKAIQGSAMEARPLAADD